MMAAVLESRAPASPLDPYDLEERLEAWAVFWRWRNSGQQQAESFEGQYRSPQRWDRLPIPPQQLDVDVDDVHAIESAVCALDLFHHVLLKAWYILRISEDSCMAKARKAAGKGTRRRFRVSMAEAKALLYAELERPAVVRKQRASEMVRQILGLDPLTYPERPT